MTLSPPRSPAATVVCFGEVLWDCLPTGLFLGGAPLNVAYHVARHGLRAIPLSAVGRDFLGDEALRRMKLWGLETRYVARRGGYKTGVVQASVDRAGVPSFEIRRSAAWDHIPAARTLLRGRSPEAIVYGTLALREATNQRTLTRLIEAWPKALRVADLNFRTPYDTKEVITFALRSAQMVKVNDVELARLTGAQTLATGGLERAARTLARRERIARICVTAGSRGAGLLWDGDWFWRKAQAVRVRDTIGAGDAFLGGLLAALFGKGAQPEQALRHACQVAGFVAGSDGATPPYRLGPDGRPIATTE